MAATPLSRRYISDKEERKAASPLLEDPHISKAETKANQPTPTQVLNNGPVKFPAKVIKTVKHPKPIKPSLNRYPIKAPSRLSIPV